MRTGVGISSEVEIVWSGYIVTNEEAHRVRVRVSFFFLLFVALVVRMRAYIHTYMYISIYRYIMFCYITGYFFSVLVVVQKKRGLSRFLPKVSCALKTGSKKNDRSEPKLLPAIVSSVIRWYLEKCVLSMNFVLRMCSLLPFLFLLPFVWPWRVLSLFVFLSFRFRSFSLVFAGLGSRGGGLFCFADITVCNHREKNFVLSTLAFSLFLSLSLTIYAPYILRVR